MRSLVNFIEDNTALHTDIYEDLSKIDNEVVSLSLDQFIFERNGEYDGCDEICEFILLKMKEHNNDNHSERYVLHFTSDDLKNLQNVFFKELFINVDISPEVKENTAKYEIWQKNIENYDAFKYDEKENLFNFVSIDVNVIEHGVISSDMFSHELNHAYEDYNRYAHKSDTLYKYVDDYGYTGTTNDIKYKHMNKYEKFTNVLLYVLSEHEQNAFISQLVNIVKKKASSLHNMKELYEYVYKNDELFRSFNKLYNNFKYYVNHEGEWKMICKYYNQITKKNYTEHRIYSFTAEHEIYGVLSDEVYKFRKRLVKHIRDEFVRNV